MFCCLPFRTEVAPKALNANKLNIEAGSGTLFAVLTQVASYSEKRSLN
ncbi:hypothetical protein COO91_08898 [Nostoc flagelliforme CCNUN1]|uniref:Uncharacterized protein n=1 Tax=Nostoc flagelliforme CCNUN1 TaxID=2038116 RepID=A0A2K8T4W8_9NOSO|nr:hypothetical protein COO91_08898 [Nostoc flagelliforme CCNUN1]